MSEQSTQQGKPTEQTPGWLAPEAEMPEWLNQKTVLTDSGELENVGKDRTTGEQIFDAYLAASNYNEALKVVRQAGVAGCGLAISYASDKANAAATPRIRDSYNFHLRIIDSAMNATGIVKSTGEMKAITREDLVPPQTPDTRMSNQN